jgi:hypothetical protein
MRTELGIPNTPPLQRYQLRPKSLEARNSSEKVGDGQQSKFLGLAFPAQHIPWPHNILCMCHVLLLLLLATGHRGAAVQSCSLYVVFILSR